MWTIEIREEPNPFLARVIIAGDWGGNVEVAKRLLGDVYERWPKGKRVKFLITCGGFVSFEWPQHLSYLAIGDNKNPNRQAVNVLIEEAEKNCQRLLSGDLHKKLAECTDYLTLGVDSFKEKVSLTTNYISEPHVELVALIDLRTDSYYWTGKSYPISDQQSGLVRISDLKTHFLDDTRKVMILGCHDLKVFDPRHYKRKNMSNWRKIIIKEFHELAIGEQPVLVLQHPHETDCVEGINVRGKNSPGTWDRAWKHLRKIVKSVNNYASAGKYYNSDYPCQERSKLVDVLAKTKNCHTIDFIVHIK